MKIIGSLAKRNLQEPKAKVFTVYSGLNNMIRPLISQWLIALILLAIGVASDVFAEKIAFESVRKETIKVTGKIVDRYFFVEFSTLSFINPAAFDYFISAYENQQMPYDGQHKPVATDNVTCTTSHCSYALEAPITNAPYIVGIGSSHSIKTISATLNFTPGNSEGVAFNPSVSVLELGINSVIVAYEMPPGYQPIDSKSWVAIWQGQASSSISPIGKAAVNSRQSSGSQAIHAITIQVGATYTIGLFSGSNNEDIVAIATIKVNPY